jgi:glycerol-3-phosphate dehydrogenase
MWVFEEDYGGRKLTDVINERHENPKYLPGVPLGANVVADPDLESAVRDADVLVFCAPHQFMRSICKTLVGKVRGEERGRGLCVRFSCSKCCVVLVWGEGLVAVAARQLCLCSSSASVSGP